MKLRNHTGKIAGDSLMSWWLILIELGISLSMKRWHLIMKLLEIGTSFWED